MEGNDRRYAGLKVLVGDSLFAAYDPLDIKAAKYLIVASSDYLYTPRSTHIDVSSGCKEDDGWRWSDSVGIISNTGRGLAVSGTGTV